MNSNKTVAYAAIIPLLLIGIYLFFFKGRSQTSAEIDSCVARGGKWNYEEGVCEAGPPQEAKIPKREPQELGSIHTLSSFQGGSVVFTQEIGRDSIGSYMRMEKEYRNSEHDTSVTVRFDESLWELLEERVNLCFAEHRRLRRTKENCRSEFYNKVTVYGTESNGPEKNVIGGGSWGCGLEDADSDRWYLVRSVIDSIYPDAFMFNGKRF